MGRPLEQRRPEGEHGPGDAPGVAAPRVPWLPILMYHRVVPRVEGPDPHHLCVSVARFEAQVRFLRARGYTALTLEELADALLAGAPTPAKAAVVTFDDGYRDVLLHALPVLRHYGIPATLFLVTGGRPRASPCWPPRSCGGLWGAASPSAPTAPPTVLCRSWTPTRPWRS